jgi:acetyl esterase/lipase
MLSRRTLLINGSAAAGASVLSVGAPALWAAPPPAYDVQMQTLTYSSRGGKDLVLDLFLPQGVKGRLPVIIFLHGGGWSGGTRTTGPDFKRFFAQDGFAMASIEYTLTSPTVTFPTNAEDVKTAVRWLRANSKTYNLNPDRIGLWGTSAGGQLSGIVGLSPRGTFEGEGNLGTSSAVQCVLDAYGPSSFTLMDAETAQEAATLQPIAPALAAAPPMLGGVVVQPGQPAPSGPPRGTGIGALGPHDAPTSAESKLVGAPIQTVPDKVRIASPLTYVTGNAPPFLLMHGLADNSVPHTQSILTYEALAAANNDVTLRLIDGLPHTFFNRTNLDDLAGPFRMDVRRHPVGGPESKFVDHAKVFDVARAFFTTHLT